MSNVNLFGFTSNKSEIIFSTSFNKTSGYLSNELRKVWIDLIFVCFNFRG
ncbi:MAG: hypothetical protein ACTS6P_00945 [Candidatus Hodgkinia cicadicola]